MEYQVDGVCGGRIKVDLKQRFFKMNRVNMRRFIDGSCSCGHLANQSHGKVENGIAFQSE